MSLVTTAELQLAAERPGTAPRPGRSCRSRPGRRCRCAALRSAAARAGRRRVRRRVQPHLRLGVRAGRTGRAKRRTSQVAWSSADVEQGPRRPAVRRRGRGGVVRLPAGQSGASRPCTGYGSRPSSRTAALAGPVTALRGGQGGVERCQPGGRRRYPERDRVVRARRVAAGRRAAVNDASPSRIDPGHGRRSGAAPALPPARPAAARATGCGRPARRQAPSQAVTQCAAAAAKAAADQPGGGQPPGAGTRSASCRSITRPAATAASSPPECAWPPAGKRPSASRSRCHRRHQNRK